jgi:hypothetical protein
MISEFHNLDFFFTSTSIGPVFKERSDLPIAYVRAGSSVRGLDYSPIGTGASLLENNKCCFVYKKEMKISNVIPNPNPVGVGESIDKAFLPVLLAQASSQMSMPCLSFPFWYAKASFYSIK